MLDVSSGSKNYYWWDNHEMAYFSIFFDVTFGLVSWLGSLRYLADQTSNNISRISL